MNAKAVRYALEKVIGDVDYDLHKELDYDGDYPMMTRLFMDHYNDFLESE